eukprot:285926-Chlamydomonas_euryale.AAC.6
MPVYSAGGAPGSADANSGASSRADAAPGCAPVRHTSSVRLADSTAQRTSPKRTSLCDASALKPEPDSVTSVPPAAEPCVGLIDETTCVAVNAPARHVGRERASDRLGAARRAFGSCHVWRRAFKLKARAAEQRERRGAVHACGADARARRHLPCHREVAARICGRRRRQHRSDGGRGRPGDAIHEAELREVGVVTAGVVHAHAEERSAVCRRRHKARGVPGVDVDRHVGRRRGQDARSEAVRRRPRVHNIHGAAVGVAGSGHQPGAIHRQVDAAPPGAPARGKVVRPREQPVVDRERGVGRRQRVAHAAKACDAHDDVPRASRQIRQRQHQRLPSGAVVGDACDRRRHAADRRSVRCGVRPAEQLPDERQRHIGNRHQLPRRRRHRQQRRAVRAVHVAARAGQHCRRRGLSGQRRSVAAGRRQVNGLRGARHDGCHARDVDRDRQRRARGKRCRGRPRERDRGARARPGVPAQTDRRAARPLAVQQLEAVQPG